MRYWMGFLFLMLLHCAANGGAGLPSSDASTASDGVVSPPPGANAPLQGGCSSECSTLDDICVEYRGNWTDTALRNALDSCSGLCGGTVLPRGNSVLDCAATQRTGRPLGGCMSTDRNGQITIEWYYQRGRYRLSRDIRAICVAVPGRGIEVQFVPPPGGEVVPVTSCAQGTLCNGSCVDTQSDSYHCGGCSRICGDRPPSACMNGRCALADTCTVPLRECQVYGETHLICTAVPTFCGSCTTACPTANYTCESGMCCLDGVGCSAPGPR